MFDFKGNHAHFKEATGFIWILVRVRTDLGLWPSSSKEREPTDCATECSLSLAYFVWTMVNKEMLVESFRILQFQVPFP